MDPLIDARLELIIGPMGSGKTTELIRRMRRHLVCERKIIYLKSVIDTRFEDSGCIMTRDSVRAEAICTKKILKKLDILLRYDVIAIDEAQFFEDLIEGCVRLLEHGKILVVAGLSGDSRLNPFENIAQLIPKADDITFLRAVCMKCRRDAPFTALPEAPSEGQIHIGDIGMYVPCCRHCHASYQKR